MNEQRAREGVEHLQAAALEVIAAVRAFLDMAEGLVRDPGRVSRLVDDLADIGRGAGSAAAGSDVTDAADGEDAADGVTRIRVS